MKYQSSQNISDKDVLPNIEDVCLKALLIFPLVGCFSIKLLGKTNASKGRDPLLPISLTDGPTIEIVQRFQRLINGGSCEIFILKTIKMYQCIYQSVLNTKMVLKEYNI